MIIFKTLGNSVLRFGQLLIAALALMQASASAQTIIQTQDFSVGSSATNSTLTFNTFDSTQGTLLSVEIDLYNVVISGTGSVTNETGSPSDYTLRLLGDYVVSDQINGAGNSVEVFVNTPTDSTTGLASGDTFTTGTLTNSPAGSGSTTLTSGSNDLSGFETVGGGTLTLYLNSNNTVSVVGSAPFSANQSSSGIGTVKVTYTYAVPEPSDIALMVLGLGLLAGWGYSRGFRRLAA